MNGLNDKLARLLGWLEREGFDFRSCNSEGEIIVFSIVRKDRKGLLAAAMKKPGRDPAAGGEPLDYDSGVVEMDLTLPEADVGGLRFNETKVHAVFERDEDGWLQSRDILFVSARDVEADNSRDLLAAYLNARETGSARQQIAARIGFPIDRVVMDLPLKARGEKSYNGVSHPYWLAGKWAKSGNCFEYVVCYIRNNFELAIEVMGLPAAMLSGVAPRFRVLDGEGGS
jgi:hypothetical protein